MGNQPNIFEFATSELSQDAFICWLVSYANCMEPENEVLNKCARDFIALLYNLKKGPNRINGTNVERIDNLKQQYCHTDVYFQATIKGEIVSFIIEDKTYTSHHSNQLKICKDAIIEKDKIKKEELVCIYFKTGYLLPWDEKAEDFGYAILDYKKIHEFLQKYKTNNLIFESYKEYIKGFYDYYENNKNRWQKDDYECFRYYFAQLEFMKKLLEQCKQNINPDEIGDDRLYNGKNRDGTAWTQMWFIKLKSVYGEGFNESVFYRLDKRKNPERGEKPEYYLSIRQYGQVKNNPEAKQKKLERLGKYIEIFDEIEKSTSLVFSNIRKDNSGANESEIAILFFDKEKRKPTAVLEQIGKIHEQFVKRIQLTDTIMNS